MLKLSKLSLKFQRLVLQAFEILQIGGVNDEGEAAKGAQTDGITRL